MTREHAKKILPIITAFANGEEVQYEPLNKMGKWGSVQDPGFQADPSAYRIAPKPRVIFVNEYDSELFSTWQTRSAADAVALVSRVACHEITIPPLD